MLVNPGMSNWNDAGTTPTSRERSAAEPDGTSDCARIAAEVPSPESFADHDNVWRRPFITALKGAAGDRRDPEHIEEVRRHGLSISGCATPSAPVIDVWLVSAAAIASNVRLRSLQSTKSSGFAAPRRPSGSDLRHGDESIGVGVWQRPQQRRVGDGEHRAVGADAERQRQHGDHRECR